MADDIEHGKLSQGAKRSVDAIKAFSLALAKNAEWVLGKGAARVLGAGALFAVVVALLFVFLNWYVAPVKPGEKKDLVLALAQILAGTALLSGLYFTWRTLQVNREGQITERFTRAIDQLGKVEDGQKLFEIRVGGIYALERIAKESEEDYWPIMEILTAYVRQNASSPPKAGQERTEDATDEQRAMEEAVGKLDPDIQAIMTILRRRTRYHKQVEPEPFNLSETNLPRADLTGANLTGTYFTQAYLPRASFTEADLTGAFLVGADLTGAYLPRADLTGAWLIGADLTGANLTGANLTGARLTTAHLSGADLTGAHLSQEQVELTFGDENTKLPPQLKRPTDWGVKTDEPPEED